jgi:serine-type D-Ala-D-Ala carboxypeptidase
MITPTVLRHLGRRFVVRPAVAPACVLAVAVRPPRPCGGGGRQAIAQVIGGASGVASPTRGIPATEATLFDLASVTKPFVAVAFARLWTQGLLTPDMPLGALVSEARGTPTEHVPLELLLSHRAGLVPHVEYFDPMRRGGRVDARSVLRRAAGARRPECAGRPPREGFAPVYSDLGYLLLGRALEAARGGALDELVDQEVCRPLRLEVASARLWQAHAPERLSVCAETETVAFRGGPVIGAVHDENAWALSGLGLSGHAGLFGTAESVARFGAALLDALAGRRAGFLPPAVARWLVQPRPGGTLRAGFDGKSQIGSSAGTRIGPLAFGHLGFTGTSLWCDPSTGRALVILTNRVCPSRENTSLRDVRPRLGDALMDALEAPPARTRTARRKTPEVGHFCELCLAAGRNLGRMEGPRCGN